MKYRTLGKSGLRVSVIGLGTHQFSGEWGKIFTQKEVDELIFLDITATRKKRQPQFKLISEIATECFMPFCYGGAGSIEHFKDAINKGGASAVAAGSMFVFYGRHRAVLISYPNKQELDIFNLTPSL